MRFQTAHFPECLVPNGIPQICGEFLFLPYVNIRKQTYANTFITLQCNVIMGIREQVIALSTHVLHREL